MRTKYVCILYIYVCMKGVGGKRDTLQKLYFYTVYSIYILSKSIQYDPEFSMFLPKTRHEKNIFVYATLIFASVIYKNM